METLFLLVVVAFSLTELVHCGEPYTYWVDRTCRRFGSHFEDAMNEALSNAGTAAQRLISNDPLQHEYFRRIFSPPGQQGQRKYEELAQKVASILGHPTLRPGISGIVPVPNNDQSLSNYRYFCDNDHLHPSGSSRWSIRNDPVPLPPKPYIPQKERPGPFWDYIPPDADQLQDLVDIRNGVGMSAPWGCHAKHVKAATASAKLPGPYRQPIRATTTVCDSQLKSRKTFSTFSALPRGINFGKSFASSRFGPTTPIDFLTQLTSTVLLHELFHLPPWRLKDEPMDPNDRLGQKARGWKRSLALDPDRRLNNVDSYMFFGLLAMMRDHGWRLARDEDRANAGEFERV